MSKPLYELANMFVDFARVLADETEMPNEIIDEYIDAQVGPLEFKGWNIAAMVLQFEGEAEMIRAAEKRMAVRRKHLENRAEWLRDYLLVQLIRAGIDEIQSPEFVVKVCDNPPRVILDDEEAIPEQFKEQETVVTILKNELRIAMVCDGEVIPGCHLEKGKCLNIS